MAADEVSPRAYAPILSSGTVHFIIINLVNLLIYSSCVPRLVPFINWSYFQLLHSKPQSRVDQSYKVFI